MVEQIHREKIDTMNKKDLILLEMLEVPSF